MEPTLWKAINPETFEYDMSVPSSLYCKKTHMLTRFRGPLTRRFAPVTRRFESTTSRIITSTSVPDTAPTTTADTTALVESVATTIGQSLDSVSNASMTLSEFLYSEGALRPYFMTNWIQYETLGWHVLGTGWPLALGLSAVPLALIPQWFKASDLRLRQHLPNLQTEFRTIFSAQTRDDEKKMSSYSAKKFNDAHVKLAEVDFVNLARTIMHRILAYTIPFTVGTYGINNLMRHLAPAVRGNHTDIEVVGLNSGLDQVALNHGMDLLHLLTLPDPTHLCVLLPWFYVISTINFGQLGSVTAGPRAILMTKVGATFISAGIFVLPVTYGAGLFASSFMAVDYLYNRYGWKKWVELRSWYARKKGIKYEMPVLLTAPRDFKIERPYVLEAKSMWKLLTTGPQSKFGSLDLRIQAATQNLK